MNPVRKLIEAGVPRKAIVKKTGLTEPEISFLLTGRRNASIRIRKAFYDAFGVSPWDWDNGKK